MRRRLTRDQFEQASELPHEVHVAQEDQIGSLGATSRLLVAPEDTPAGDPPDEG
jgi:hypothetical protein